MTRPAVAFALALLLCAATPAAAGIEPGMGMSFGSGFVHPFLGTDHLLAMVAMGAIAAAHHGTARLALPAAFVAGMGLGLVLGTSGVHIPFVEMLIVSSVVILGGLLASGLTVPVVLGAGLAGMLSLFHGEAHGLEIGGASFLPFAVGVLMAAAVLQTWGLGFASILTTALGQSTARIPVRMLGAGIALGGLVLVFAG